MKKLINVEKTYNGMRIDRFLRNHLGKIPQSLIEKNLRNGKIKLNNKKIKSSFKVQSGDKVNFYNFYFKKNEQKKNEKFKVNKNIIKENEELIIENNNDFVVLNKKSGISVQGGTKSKKNLIDIFANSTIFQDTKPYSVHRLDKDTSGIFMIAKNRQTAQLLTSLFRLRKIHKTYLAICHGEVEKNKGSINHDLIRYDNKKKIIEKAITIFDVLDKNNNTSLVKMKPITGRKHQLRKHLFMIGNSVLGDKKYNSKGNIKSKNKNLMLHSYELKFKINDVKHTYKAPLPDYFEKMLKAKRLIFRD